VWTQIGNTIPGEGNADRFGRNLSFSADGTVLAVSGYLNSQIGLKAGHVRVFQNISNVWTQVGNDIDGEVALESSGFDVSLSADGTTVAVGVFLSHSNGDRSGTVRIYENISGSWIKKVNDI